MILLKPKILVTVQIMYFLPDYRNLLQEFIWQTNDTTPDYPRVHKFLNFWKENICAPISEVNVCNGGNSSFRRIDSDSYLA